MTSIIASTPKAPMNSEFDNRVVEVTDDGSATIFLPELDEHYHSVKGALTESCHIYRDCGFMHRSTDGKRLRLLEVGFGTGLNAVVTAMAADQNRQVDYFTLEKYPVSSDMVAALGYGVHTDQSLLTAIHAAPWGELAPITTAFSINKIKCDFTVDALPQNIDVVYFDAFAPEKQPEMWSPEIFARVYDVMNSGGVLTTYCAKGVIRRQLEAVGFVVERLAGPVGGKREILRATKR